MPHSLLVESRLVLDSTNYWWIDSSSTNHVCNSSQGVQSKEKIELQDMYLTLAFEARIVVQAMGDVTLI